MGAFFEVIDTAEFTAAEAGFQMSGHHAVEDIAFTDKVRDKSVCRFIVNVLRCTDLLCAAFAHDDDLVGHGQRFFLVMGDIDKGDAQLVMHVFELKLHLLAHLQVQSPQRLIQKEDFGLIDQGTGYGDPLLLSAGKCLDPPALEALQIHQFQNAADLAGDLICGGFFLTQSKGNIVIDVHVRKKRIALKDRVDRPLIRRQPYNGFPVQENVSLGWDIKSCDHPQRRGLSAA